MGIEPLTARASRFSKIFLSLFEKLKLFELFLRYAKAAILLWWPSPLNPNPNPNPNPKILI